MSVAAVASATGAKVTPQVDLKQELQNSAVQVIKNIQAAFAKSHEFNANHPIQITYLDTLTKKMKTCGVSPVKLLSNINPSVNAGIEKLGPKKAIFNNLLARVIATYVKYYEVDRTELLDPVESILFYEKIDVEFNLKNKTPIQVQEIFKKLSLSNLIKTVCLKETLILIQKCQ